MSVTPFLLYFLSRACSIRLKWYPVFPPLEIVVSTLALKFLIYLVLYWLAPCHSVYSVMSDSTSYTIDFLVLSFSWQILRTNYNKSNKPCSSFAYTQYSMASILALRLDGQWIITILKISPCCWCWGRLVICILAPSFLLHILQRWICLAWMWPPHAVIVSLLFIKIWSLLAPIRTCSAIILTLEYLLRTWVSLVLLPRPNCGSVGPPRFWCWFSFLFPLFIVEVSPETINYGSKIHPF